MKFPKKIKVIRTKPCKAYCVKCGRDLYYYIDGNNQAITNNQKGKCKNCNLN